MQLRLLGGGGLDDVEAAVAVGVGERHRRRPRAVGARAGAVGGVAREGVAHRHAACKGAVAGAEVDHERRRAVGRAAEALRVRRRDARLGVGQPAVAREDDVVVKVAVDVADRDRAVAAAAAVVAHAAELVVEQRNLRAKLALAARDARAAEEDLRRSAAVGKDEIGHAVAVEVSRRDGARVVVLAAGDVDGVVEVGAPVEHVGRARARHGNVGVAVEVEVGHRRARVVVQLAVGRAELEGLAPRRGEVAVVAAVREARRLLLRRRADLRVALVVNVVRERPAADAACPARRLVGAHAASAHHDRGDVRDVAALRGGGATLVTRRDERDQVEVAVGVEVCEHDREHLAAQQRRLDALVRRRVL